MIGQTLGHYRIIEKVGAGGMGEVYQAEDSQLRRRVALKFLPEKTLGDRAAVERFIREARAASALNHPNIVTIHEIGETGPNRYIVMEFIAGRTLRKIIGQGVDLESLARIGEQVARALAVAHAAGIVHRDIKPDNIMVRDDGYVKVLDFGLARLARSGGATTLGADAGETGPGTILGTVRYMSPEQARGEVTESPTDIFSLGIVLYELGTGRHPFPAESHLGVMHAIVSETPIRPSRMNPEVPAALDSLILRLLEKDARLRPSAAEVESELRGLSGAHAASAASRAVAPVERHTVGRQRELEELRAAFDSAESGRGLLVCVAGEPGIGKTTLVEDFLAALAAGGRACSIARGRCSERLAGTEAYLPLLEALESLLKGEGSSSLAAALKRVAPTWYVQVAPLAANDSSVSRIMEEAKAASQERLKRELSAFLQEASRLRPLVFFLDDLHWADVSTVDLLAYVGSKCDSLRMLIIGTYRPSDLLLSKHPFADVKLVLQGRGVCRELAVAFLTPAEVELYLARDFPEHRFPPEFASLIHAKTEGSPLFMVDLIRYLRHRGVIVEKDPGRWALAGSLPEIQRELPESVRSMIQRKIDQLSDAERRLLAAASVQGQEFDSSVVAKVLQMDAAEVEERLEVLERVHLFVRRLQEQEFPDSSLTLRYAFVHALYQNALYAALAPTRRTSLSAAVAGALETFYGDRSGEIASTLAFLYEAARDFARAADFFLRASQNSARVYANQEAVSLARRALANAEKLQGKDRASRVLSTAFELARFHQTLSQFDEAIADFAMAEKAAVELGNKEGQIDSVCGTAMSLFNLKRMPEMRQHANRALEIARAAGSSVGIASAETVLACDRLCTGDLAAAEEHFRSALPVLREKGAQLGVVDAFSYYGALHTWRLDYAEAEHMTGWALEKAREIGASFHIVENLFFRGMALGNQGRLSDALGALEEARRVAELNGERYWLPRLPNTIGWIYREMQDLEVALKLDTENVHLADEMGVIEGRANAHVNLGHDYLALGEPERAFENLQQAEQLFNQDVWFRWRYAIRMQAELASYWIARGDLKMAAIHATASLEAAEMSRSRKYLAWGHKLLGDIAVLEERMEDARREYRTALEALAQNPCPMIEWQILKASAGAAPHAKSDSTAEELLGRARAVIQSLAGSIRDDSLRRKFLAARPFREL
jgi:tRNA A-37 threonylcarbamoyl transferase component Bud32/tetratricopeptide (TPR) repeat protein